ncbi:hypothetical protein ANAEL_03424 [Anaerolineales bacterium]|nr:hypothetical protein ANAEL_03424 [Anaerolineales bacterium]
MTIKPRYILIVHAVVLAACGRVIPQETEMTKAVNTALAIAQTDIALTQTAMPTVTPTNTPTALPTATTTPTLIPTQLPAPVLTPDTTQVEKWEEYQTELANAVLSSNPERGSEPVAYENALCEWDILGQSGQEVYVFAICALAEENGNTGRLAIIYLAADESIRSVKVAEFKGSFYDLGLYPADIQQKFCYYFPFSPPDRPPCLINSVNPGGRIDVLRTHLDYRQINPAEPPLVVLSATPTP